MSAAKGTRDAPLSLYIYTYTYETERSNERASAFKSVAVFGARHVSITILRARPKGGRKKGIAVHAWVCAGASRPPGKRRNDARLDYFRPSTRSLFDQFLRARERFLALQEGFFLVYPSVRIDARQRGIGREVFFCRDNCMMGRNNYWGDEQEAECR